MTSKRRAELLLAAATLSLLWRDAFCATRTAKLQEGYPCKAEEDCDYLGCRDAGKKIYCAEHCGYNLNDGAGADFYICPDPPPKCLAKPGFYCRDVRDRPDGTELLSAITTKIFTSH